MRSAKVIAALFLVGCPDQAMDGDGDAIPASIAVGDYHSCAVRPGGEVRCWGYNPSGNLGYLHEQTIGDDEHPASEGDIDVGGGPIVSVAAGYNHTCARLEGGALRCWGSGFGGALGYGNMDSIGDDEPPANAGDVDVGGPVIAIGAGNARTCAIVEGGGVRCWGHGGNSEVEFGGGPLGYGNLESIGDDETPANAGDIDVGGVAVALAVGDKHTCVVLEGGAVRCWGNADEFGDHHGGRLGYGNAEDIGDNETPASACDVDVGQPAVAVAAGAFQTCALLVGGAVRCWGYAGHGALGYGNAEDIGDDEAPSSAGDVPLGGTAIAVSAGADHTCALMQSGGVRCWGNGSGGRLGYGNEDDIGSANTPADVGDIELGGIATEISVGTLHTCALLDGGTIRCWGRAVFGQLGYANELDIGDDETPASAGDVRVE
jgi:alpha-tubulin suppressor-like RCC1 family protein